MANIIYNCAASACLLSILIILISYIWLTLTLTFKLIYYLYKKPYQHNKKCKHDDHLTLQIIISCFNEANTISIVIKNILCQVYPVDDVPREPNGKFRAVISKLPRGESDLHVYVS